MNLNKLFDWVERVGAPLLRPISSRLNPIMVKEVRQSLRGNYFHWSFLVVTLLATVAGCGMLYIFAVDSDSRGGMYFFITMFAILSAAVNVLVPFQTFISVGAEWDENTFDLLVLSELTPLQIVKGKLLSGLVQALLFYVSFAPFLVFSFLLRGLDLASAAWVLAVGLIYSIALCSLAICFSSLVTQKFARVLLMAILVALLVLGCIGSVAIANVVLEERMVHNIEFLRATSAAICLAIALAFFFILLAAGRFTHAEENRSTGLRVLVTLMTLVGTGWLAYMYLVFRSLEILHFGSLLGFVGITLFSTIFCAESESLGRRVALLVPRSSLACLCFQPFLPGGGRGVLHYFLNISIVLGSASALPWLSGTHAGYFSGIEMIIPLGMLPYLACYLLIPTGLMARWSGRLRNRVLARIFVPLLFLFGMLLPMLLIFLTTGHSDAFDHLGNPFTTINDTTAGVYGELWWVALLAGLVSLLNLPRVLRSFGELRVARISRLERERLARVLDLPSDGGGAPRSDALASS